MPIRKKPLNSKQKHRLKKIITKRKEYLRKKSCEQVFFKPYSFGSRKKFGVIKPDKEKSGDLENCAENKPDVITVPSTKKLKGKVELVSIKPSKEKSANSGSEVEGRLKGFTKSSKKDSQEVVESVVISDDSIDQDILKPGKEPLGTVQTPGRTSVARSFVGDKSRVIIISSKEEPKLIVESTEEKYIFDSSNSKESVEPSSIDLSLQPTVSAAKQDFQMDRIDDIDFGDDSMSPNDEPQPMIIGSGSGEDDAMEVSQDTTDRLVVPLRATKVIALNYIRKVELSYRTVNLLSRQNHFDLYELFFLMFDSVKNFSNYTVQMLVAKSKHYRKVFLRKLPKDSRPDRFEFILKDLPGRLDAHQIPASFKEFKYLDEKERRDLQRFIDNIKEEDCNYPSNSEGVSRLSPTQFLNRETLDLRFNFDRLYGYPAETSLGRSIIRSPETSPVFSFKPSRTELSLPRLTIISALVGQKKRLKRVRPALTVSIMVENTPKRFIAKFVNLMSVGFCFLGKLIIASLSPDPNVNKENLFDFVDGDVGFWWAGVIIIDWNEYLTRRKSDKFVNTSISCVEYLKTVGEGDTAYKAMLNIGPDGLYFTELDQKNFQETIETIRHRRVPATDPDIIVPG